MQKVNEQRLPAAPAEEAGNGRFFERTGKPRLLFPVDGFAEGGADEKIAQLRENREVIARRKALIDKAQREQPVLRNDHAPDRKAGGNDDSAQTGKHGSRQSFDKSKLINGMVRACDKRKVPLPVLEKIADEIEQELQSALEREITTEQVGEMVMKRLKDVDEVAYVRFASVYRQFKDIDTFMQELTKLLNDRG